MSAQTPEGPPTHVSLREQLGGTPDPEFSLVLPPGWERHGVTDAEQEKILHGMRRRFLDAQRPELFARMKQLVTESFAQMKKASTVAMFTAGDQAGTLHLPASLTASIQHAEPGENLDGFVRSAITTAGATPLLGDKRFLRAERETRETLDGDSALVTTVMYLTPIPGTQRRRALMLTLVIMRPLDAPADDAPLMQMKALFDACVSTLTWVPEG